jgi:hypothetical protein
MAYHPQTDGHTKRLNRFGEHDKDVCYALTQVVGRISTLGIFFI